MKPIKIDQQAVDAMKRMGEAAQRAGDDLVKAMARIQTRRPKR